MEQEQPKSVSQHIIDALLTGERLTIHEIAGMVREAAKRKVASQDIASMMARIQSRQKCDFGFFINREKDDKRYVYQVVPEILQVPIDKIYSLARKTGKDRYTLIDLVKEYPNLKPYVDEKTLEAEKEKVKAKPVEKPAAKSKPNKRQATRKTRSSRYKDKTSGPDLDSAIAEQPEQPDQAPASTSSISTELSILNTETIAKTALAAIGQAIGAVLPDNLQIKLNLNVTVRFEGFSIDS